MSGGRPIYFTVSETLQAVVDEIKSDDDHDDELWADDEVSLEPTPCTSSTAVARSPPTPTLVSPGLESLSHSKLIFQQSSTPIRGRPESVVVQSLPKSIASESLSTESVPPELVSLELESSELLLSESGPPAPKRHCTDVNCSISSPEVSNAHDDTHFDPSATQLARTYFVVNPPTLPNPENGDSVPNDLQLVQQQVSKGCGCSQSCFSRMSVTPQDILMHRFNMIEVSKPERDMLVMAAIHTGMHMVGNSKQNRTTYRYQNVEVCVGTFLFLHAITLKYLKAIRSWYLKNGLVPRVHGNVGRKPRHTFGHDIIEGVVQFIKLYTEVHGMPQPAAPRGRSDAPPIYLPASQNFKTVHAQYVAACTINSSRHVGYSVFKSVWHQCMPHVRFMTPRTDVCGVCEDMRHCIQSALTEDEKIAATSQFRVHIENAQDEREHYKMKTISAKEEYDAFRRDSNLPTCSFGQCLRPCSVAMRKCHYTFDFAEQLHLPNHARQVGPLYFKVPYRVQLFGVCDEARPQQTNYLFGENDTIGENGTKCHGPNCVVSMHHHFFDTHGNGEEECFLHADNCGGQNKNKTVLAYLAWRCIVGLHQQITYYFMITGHTQCLVDGCFGLIKQKYRRSE